jgi:predicted polyphosphate/ATP-dependent NAD kinase
MLRIGLIINPIAGVGGATGLKGSDSAEVQARAIARGAKPRAGIRTAAALAGLAPVREQLEFYTWGGAMGADVIRELGFVATVLGTPRERSGAEDTREAARAMVAAGVDLLLFAGGDGTARDLAEVLPARMPVIGIPAGVKMHSGVFAVTPQDVAALVLRLLKGGLVAVRTAEVRDVDETALRAGSVATRYYGELWVPAVGGYLQHVKSGGREVEALVVEEIAAAIGERLDEWFAAHPDSVVVLGPGSTVAVIKSRCGIEPTLLGFDALRAGVAVGRDLDAVALDDLIDARTVIVLSFSRGQGFLLGRGNQQLTPELLRRIPREQLWVVGSRSKLATLEGRPLLLDSGAADVDAKFAGLIEVVGGYDDVLLYRAGQSSVGISTSSAP